jgi:2-polyprenyl-3-methyl-5-hydroxy-6-metoxy-1,4-benzoquinol methylase
MNNLLDAGTHFKFGENWKSFVQLVDERRISLSVEGLRALVGPEVAGASFLDIGCGSGLSSLAAARLGARRITSVDIDSSSVQAATLLLAKWLRDVPWTAQVRSIFEMTPEADGQFEVVYSWGVLHHTGDMWRAIESAAALVAPGGVLAVALYRQTSTDPFWKLEKAFYSRTSKSIQALMRSAYNVLHLAAELFRGKPPSRHAAEYEKRGMDRKHDVHDWLGGFPYETVGYGEVETRLAPLGFTLVRERVYSPKPTLGLFGSFCDEWVLRRKPSLENQPCLTGPA